LPFFVGCSAIRRLISDELRILQSLWLTKQLSVIGRSPALRADVSGVCDKLLVKLEVGLQLLLHFAQRFGHLKSIPNKRVQKIQNSPMTLPSLTAPEFRQV
jgi:hypothetical protein